METKEVKKKWRDRLGLVVIALICILAIAGLAKAFDGEVQTDDWLVDRYNNLCAETQKTFNDKAVQELQKEEPNRELVDQYNDIAGSDCKTIFEKLEDFSQAETVQPQ